MAAEERRRHHSGGGPHMNQASLRRGGSLLAPLCLSAMAALAAPVAAGTDAVAPIVTDRSQFVPATSIIGEGNVQIETGIARTQDGDGTALFRQWSTPTMVRLGMRSYE